MTNVFRRVLSGLCPVRLVRRLLCLAVAGLAMTVPAHHPGNAGEAVFVPGPTIEDGDIVLGDANAPITVYEYMSYLCADCREYRWGPHIRILRRLVDSGEIRIVQRDFPLSELAFKAALVARCVPPEHYDRMVVELLWFQHVWSAMDDPLRGLSSTALAYGVPRDAFASCLGDQHAIDRVAETLAAGQVLLGVERLPTFFFVMEDVVVRAEGVLSLEGFREIIAAVKTAAEARR